MSTQFCVCGEGLKNLGTPSCPTVLKTIKKHIFVPLTDSEGNRNSILLTDLVDGGLTDTYIASKLFETDGSKRWYPTPDVYENVSGEVTDTITETFDSGRIERIQSGVQQFDGLIPSVDPQLASKIVSSGCSDIGVFEIDKSNNLRGEISADGSELYPIEVEKGSLDSKNVTATDTTVSKVQVTFQFSQTVNTANLRQIAGSSTPVNLLKLNGMIDAALTILSVPAVTATTFTASLVVKDFGNFGSDIAIQGKTDVPDWLLLDAALAPITISSVVESTVTPGNYDFTFTSTPAETVTLDFVEVPTTSLDQGFESDSTTTTTP